MTYKALDIAKWFINQFDRESGDFVTHLKVQKLLYYAEAWHQVLLEKELFEESIQAWAHGPVVPQVFQKFQKFSWNPIDPMKLNTKFNPETLEVLEQVFDIYGSFPAKTLENKTHQDAPWLEARGNLASEERCENIIPKMKLKKFFQEKYADYLNEKESI